MKSKISIDLDQDGKPVISISHVKSDDLRDKAVGMFIGNFRYENGAAHVEFKGTFNIPDSDNYKSLVQTSLGTYDLWMISPKKSNSPIPSNKKLVQGIPRRSLISERTAAETAIQQAMIEVEKAGADTLLTNAIMHLQNALTEVGNFVDDQK